MIIKKKFKSKDPDESAKKPAEKKFTPEFPILKKSEPQEFSKTIIRERQERRRGDRRRGYRRVEDRNLISRAHEEANAIKESACKEGFEYGVRLSVEELKKLNQAIIELLTAKEKVMHNSIPDIALIAVKAAEKIIKKELEINDTIILEVVSEVINSISRDEKEIIIKTHPNDTEIVKERIPDIYPYESTTKIIVMEDESVDWGSCIVETKNGIIDARFSTQLQVLEKALRSGI